jgi:predicted Rossmann fold nucleotide-binding protein DprA/Smf involved in DNA uptake
MAKKRPKRIDTGYPARDPDTMSMPETKSGHNLKEMLSDDAWAKLKQLEREMKAQKEREAQEEAKRRRREQEERERNKSFAELLEEYEKKGGGKYS